MAEQPVQRAARLAGPGENICKALRAIGGDHRFQDGDCLAERARASLRTHFVPSACRFTRHRRSLVCFRLQSRDRARDLDKVDAST
ncbi:hypothetical protein D3C71_2124550 [compost metagenome]